MFINRLIFKLIRFQKTMLKLGSIGFQVKFNIQDCKWLGSELILSNQIKGAQWGALFKSEIYNWDKHTTLPKWQLQTWIWNFPPHWAPICCQDSWHNSDKVPTLFPCKFNEFGYLFLYDRWAVVVRASGSDGMMSRSDGLPSIVGLALSRYMTPI